MVRRVYLFEALVTLFEFKDEKLLAFKAWCKSHLMFILYRQSYVAFWLENVTYHLMCMQSSWLFCKKKLLLILFTLQERKKLIKDAQKEKRQSKTPKHVKKRKEKLAKAGKKKWMCSVFYLLLKFYEVL